MVVLPTLEYKVCYCEPFQRDQFQTNIPRLLGRSYRRFGSVYGWEQSPQGYSWQSSGVEHWYKRGFYASGGLTSRYSIGLKPLIVKTPNGHVCVVERSLRPLKKRLKLPTTDLHLNSINFNRRYHGGVYSIRMVLRPKPYIVGCAAMKKCVLGDI